jgi:hypothetical protein
MHHRIQHYKFRKRLAGVAAIALLGGLIAANRRADAHSLGDAGALIEESGAPATAVPEGYDGATTTSVEDVPASPAPDGSEVDYRLPDAPSVSTRSAGEAVSGSEQNQVLEIPQLIEPSSELDPYGASNGSTTLDDNGDGTESGQGDQAQTAELPAEVGSLQDYEEQVIEPPPGMMAYAPGVAALPFARPFGIRPVPKPGAPLNGMIIASPIILPPTSAGPLPSTSPMLMSPRFVAPGYALPGGAWARPRR